MDDVVADYVRRERLRRDWSIRRCASMARENPLSNTYWGRFEDYKQELTDLLRAAVAEVFQWPEDWPDEAHRLAGSVKPTFATVERVEQLQAQLDRLEDRFERAVRLGSKGARAARGSAPSRRDSGRSS